MRQRKTTTSRSERLFLLILSLITLSGLALYAFAPHSSPAPQQPMQTTEAGSTSESNAPEGKQPHRDSLIRDPHYVGPPAGAAARGEKFAHYVSLDLNRIDSLTLLRVPGIGPAYAHRILALRERLGGYYTVLQLQEVYGMDEDKFLALRQWFVIKTPPKRFALPPAPVPTPSPGIPTSPESRVPPCASSSCATASALAGLSCALLDLSPARIAFASAPTSWTARQHTPQIVFLINTHNGPTMWYRRLAQRR